MSERRPKAEAKATLPLIDAGKEADFDPWAGKYQPEGQATAPEDIRAELRRILTKGLPVNAKRAGDLLPHLRSIVSRAPHPYDLHSRVEALNRQIVRLLVDVDNEIGQPLRTLFCISMGTRGTNLTVRRERAAEEMGYEATHFRKQIEPKLLDEFAELIYYDLLRYKSRSHRALEYNEPTGDTPELTDKHLTYEEELLSRIWQHVYQLRAELIGQYRLDGQPGYERQVEEHRQNVNVATERVKALVAEYRDTFGGDFIKHGDAEFAYERIENFEL